jgi:replication initiation and membrane attachment protein DnaB
MYLTEEQIKERTELFFDIVSELAEELYDVSDDHEPTEDDLYITSILMDHFIENLKVPSLNESIQWVVSGQNPNEDLYDELIAAMLDESVGSKVASALYGVREKIAQFRRDRAQKKATKAGEAASQAKKAAKEKTPKTVIGSLKSGFRQAKAKKLAQKDQKARETFSKRINTLNTVQGKRKSLSSKIDTGISNIKQKTKSAITSGASKVGTLAGRLA